jgi:hypothetical protein
LSCFFELTRSPLNQTPCIPIPIEMKNVLFLLALVLLPLLGSAQSRYVSESTKRLVFARDGGVCQCCGSVQNLEFDHIIPYSCGGGSSPSNIQLLCQRCNRSKSNSCYCKIHNRLVGVSCCDGAPARKPTTTSVQCSGRTKKGTRCKNRTTKSNGRCHLH